FSRDWSSDVCSSDLPCRDAAAFVDWLVSDDALAAAADAWPRAIGLDTEFQRTDTFFPRPALYQVATGERVFLIDPLQVSDFAPRSEGRRVGQPGNVG